jgi:hypothetical protein
MERRIPVRLDYMGFAYYNRVRNFRQSPGIADVCEALTATCGMFGGLRHH